MNEEGPVGQIDVRECITHIPVSNLEESRKWYSRLFGKGPDLEPFEGNVEFKIGSCWVQITKDEVKPSNWSFIIEVRDLQRERERIRKAGISANEITTTPGVIRWFDLEDPDGNSMRWFQVLTTDKKVIGDRKD